MRGVDFAYLSNWPTLFDSLATCLAACGGWHLLVPSIWHDYSNKLYWGAHVAVMRILVIHLYPFVGDFSQAWFPIAMVNDQGTYIIIYIYIYNYIYIYLYIILMGPQMENTEKHRTTAVSIPKWGLKPIGFCGIPCLRFCRSVHSPWARYMWWISTPWRLPLAVPWAVPRLWMQW